MFWVWTPIEGFRLGTRQCIPFQPVATQWLEQWLCLATRDLNVVPVDETLVNLLPVLRADPSRFRSTANLPAPDTTFIRNKLSDLPTGVEATT